jgi:hypothetical protein
MQPSSANSNLAQNTTGAQMEMYTATFGNVNFAIAPSLTGEVSNTFGVIPYLSLESVIYAQGASAQIDPGRLLSGQNGGQQNIQGQYTIQDGNGLTRMVMGYQPNGF